MSSMLMATLASMGGGFDPTKLDDARLWLRPGNWTTDGSGNVSQWDDASGNGHHASQSDALARPTPTTMAGVDALQFTAGTDLLSIAHSAGLNIESGLHIWAVVRTSDSNSNRGILGKWAGGREYALLCNGVSSSSDSQWIIRNGTDSGNFIESGDRVNDGSVHMVQAIYDGTDGLLRVDDGSEGSVSVGSIRNDVADLVVGSYSVAYTVPEITIGEVVLAVTADAQERNAVREFLSSRWGVAA